MKKDVMFLHVNSVYHNQMNKYFFIWVLWDFCINFSCQFCASNEMSCVNLLKIQILKILNTKLKSIMNANNLMTGASKLLLLPSFNNFSQRFAHYCKGLLEGTKCD